MASLHSTLVEAIEADVLVHVTDAADPDFPRHIAAVDSVLDEILVEPRPPRLMVFNKSDQLSSEQASALRVDFPDCLVVSALAKDGLDVLRAELFRRSAARKRAPGKAGSGHNRRRNAVAMTEPLD